jgi:hypothetical protein
MGFRSRDAHELAKKITAGTRRGLALGHAVFIWWILLADAGVIPVPFDDAKSHTG